MSKEDKIKISFKPTKKEIDEIESWLIEEENTSGEGFYCNWNVIISSYHKKKLAVILEEKQTVGFITWYEYSQYVATIEITEIKPTHRNQGLGKQLISKLIQNLIKKNIYVIQLQCAPTTSEPIWRHLGFIDFPKHKYQWNNRNKELYKILVPHLELQENKDTDEFIELWDNEPFRTDEIDSTWKWKLFYKDGTKEFTKPIIHPCHYDWRIRYTNNDIVIKNEKVKRFTDDEIDFNSFLIIKHLPDFK